MEEEELVTCVLCLDVYTDPRTLPCLHSFCFQCLDDLLKTTDATAANFKCPLCQEKHNVPSNGASAFRQDFRIKTLLDKMKSQYSKWAQGDKESEIKCRKHPKFPLKYYCENDKMDICEACLATVHQKHPISMLSTKMKEVNKTIVLKCKEIQNQLDGVMEKVVSGKDKLSQSVSEAKFSIAKEIRSVHTQLANIQQSLYTELEKNTSSKKCMLKEINELQSLQAMIHSIKTSSPQTMSSAEELLQNISNLRTDVDYHENKLCMEFKIPFLRLAPPVLDAFMKLYYTKHALGQQSCKVTIPKTLVPGKQDTFGSHTSTSSAGPLKSIPTVQYNKPLSAPQPSIAMMNATPHASKSIVQSPMAIPTQLPASKAAVQSRTPNISLHPQKTMQSQTQFHPSRPTVQSQTSRQQIVMVQPKQIVQPQRPRLIVQPKPFVQSQTIVSQTPRSMMQPKPIVQPQTPRSMVQPKPIVQPQTPRSIVQLKPIAQPQASKSIVQPIPIVQLQTPRSMVQPKPIVQPQTTVQSQTIVLPQTSRQTNIAMTQPSMPMSAVQHLQRVPSLQAGGIRSNPSPGHPNSHLNQQHHNIMSLGQPQPSTSQVSPQQHSTISCQYFSAWPQQQVASSPAQSPRNSVNLSYISSSDKTGPAVRSMAYSPNLGLILLHENRLLVTYNKSTMLPTVRQIKSTIFTWDHRTSQIGILHCPNSKHPGNCLVGLSVIESGTKLQFQHRFTDGLFERRQQIINCKQGETNYLSTIDGFLVYSTTKILGKTLITCLRPTEVHGNVCVAWSSEVPVIGRIRSVCCIPVKEYVTPFVVCAAHAWAHYSGINTALIAYHPEYSGIVMWSRTFSDLDPNNTKFDLVDMVFDGKQILVLNGAACCLYAISVDGTRIHKVKINERGFNIKPGAWKMAVDREQHRLFIANVDHMIDIYRIDGYL